MTECAVFRAGDLEGTLVMKTRREHGNESRRRAVGPARHVARCGCDLAATCVLRIGLNRMWSILPNTTA